MEKAILPGFISDEVESYARKYFLHCQFGY